MADPFPGEPPDARRRWSEEPGTCAVKKVDAHGTLTRERFRVELENTLRLDLHRGWPIGGILRICRAQNGWRLQHGCQQLPHREVVRVGRRVVVGNVIVLLRSFQDQRNVLRSVIMQQPVKRRPPDLAFPQQNMPVLVGAQSALAVVEVKEGRGTPGSRLELIQNLAEIRFRSGDVMSRRVEVAGVQAIPDASAVAWRN